MSDFVIKPGAPACSTEQPIERTGFFPAVYPAEVRKALRVPDAVTAPRLRAALIDAIMTIDADLAAWALLQVAAGRSTLADIPADEIDGESRYLRLYWRAVGCRAKAELVERIRDLDTTGAGDRAAGMLDRTPDELRRDATHAVRDILGTTRTTIALI